MATFKALQKHIRRDIYLLVRDEFPVNVEDIKKIVFDREDYIDRDWATVILHFRKHPDMGVSFAIQWDDNGEIIQYEHPSFVLT
jgi:hypothetical protein